MNVKTSQYKTKHQVPTNESKLLQESSGWIIVTDETKYNDRETYDQERLNMDADIFIVWNSDTRINFFNKITTSFSSLTKISCIYAYFIFDTARNTAIVVGDWVLLQ